MKVLVFSSSPNPDGLTAVCKREILATFPELSGADVKATFGFTHSFHYGVRNHKDIRLL